MINRWIALVDKYMRGRHYDSYFIDSSDARSIIGHKPDISVYVAVALRIDLYMIDPHWVIAMLTVLLPYGKTWSTQYDSGRIKGKRDLKKMAQECVDYIKNNWSDSTKRAWIAKGYNQVFN